MPLYRLGDEHAFPPPERAGPDGLLAVGGDLAPGRLLLAYSLGIFPWYGRDLPILWHSPDPRWVLRPGELHVSRSLTKLLRQTRFEVRLDTAFGAVIRACADARGPGREDTWITEEMISAYEALHRLGFAHSAEAWRGSELLGGLYGVSLGGCFFGESMFARASNASKVAFVATVQQLQRWSFALVDCQVHTDHLERFGATAWRRRDFLRVLAAQVQRPTRRGAWRLDPDLPLGSAAAPRADAAKPGAES